MMFKIRDERGRVVEIESMALHNERPDIDQLCYNGIVFPPIRDPWTFRNRTPASVRVTHLSAWAGERCVAIQGLGEIGMGPDCEITVFYDPTMRSGMELVPLPTRLPRNLSIPFSSLD